MRPIARHSTRLASASRTRHPSIPRQRPSQPQRPFSTTCQQSSEARSPPDNSEHHSALNGQRDLSSTHQNDLAKDEPAGEAEEAEKNGRSTTEVADAEGRPVAETRKSSPRWNSRRKRANEVPKPPPIPQWFLDHNVKLIEHRPRLGLGDVGTPNSVQCVDAKTGHVLFTIPHRSGMDDPLLISTIYRQADSNRWVDRAEIPHILFGSQSAPMANQVAENVSASPRKDDEAPGAARADPVDPKKHSNDKEADAPPTSYSPGSSFTDRVDWPSDPLSWSFLEVEAGLRSALSLIDGSNQTSSFATDRVDLSLQCPDPNSHDELDVFVNDVAAVLAADVIRLDANDFAELCEDYVGQGDDGPGSFSNLGYDVFDGYSATRTRPSAIFKQQNTAEDENEMEEDEEDEADGQGDSHTPPKGILALLGGLEVKPHNLFVRMRDDAMRMRNNSSMDEARSTGVHRDDARLEALLDGLLEAAALKRSTQNSPADMEPSQEQKPSFEEPISTMTHFFQMHPHLWRSQASRLVEFHLHNMTAARPSDKRSHYTVFDTEPRDHRDIALQDGKKPTIVHIRDLKDISNSSLGENIIRRLVKVVRKRRKSGERIVIVGTTAQDVLGPIRLPGDRHDDFPFRTLSIPPVFQLNSRHDRNTFTASSLPLPSKNLDEPGYRRILEINLRHIQAMLRRFNADPRIDLASSKAYSQLNQPGTHFLTERILSFDEVQRLSLSAIGLLQSYALADELSPLHIALAACIFARNDHLMQACQNFKERQDEAKLKPRDPKSDDKIQAKDGSGEVKMETLKGSCNSHEKRLLSGVVDPKNIKTRFADVHAPTETTDALKTLTSLSLLRPDAFKYGVLANDRLPGLLLYGPPGTGKTLLAKAVAKDSQATVLEVTGAQVYEKYVGEGEKMVRAIFSLAKKLSPCVVFIDEADSIFGSRSNHANRNTHREIINQFLREWDGMDDHSVLMVLASNRPFDLDDAVLRRLPRRLLIDLPITKDRESILGIHLKDEILDSSVSLSKLAEQTPLYSGSDLKNLAVSAALACVREENELSELHKDDANFKLPEKRTLTSEHFDKALAEISASINENMSSLTAIRKFDEQYGDRKGRRKTTNYGFGASDGVIDESAARVRQSTATPP